MTPDLNPSQERAVLAPDAPLLIVAGAGTGKTKTLTNRLAHLIKTGVKPEKICALTFTNKAAREMSDRVHNLVAMPKIERKRDIFGAPEPFLGTFHSFGARILRQEARALGRTPGFTIFDDTDSFQLVKRMLKSIGAEKADASPSDVLGRISAVKNGMATLDDLRSVRRPAHRLAGEIYPLYEESLQKNNAFDFDDLIDKVVQLLQEHETARAKYERRFTHFLVDEYQDLNNRQYDLIRALVGEGRHLSVVGDDQQTIYSWRGSNFEIFLNFERDWPGATTVVLDQNYRSSSNIIEAASAVIQNNKKQKPKKLWTENDEGEPVRLIETVDEEQEAAWIAEEVKNARRKAKNETIAILYRTNAQSRPIEQALIEQQIPYRIYGGLKFYERREIKDLVAALRYAANPSDSVSLERLDKTFTKVVLRPLLEILRNASVSRPVELIGSVIETTKYADYAKKNLTNVEDRMENIAELLRFASEFDDLATFLERIALVQSTDDGARTAGETPALLMTIHLAKGLEFDRVFIAGCAEGLLPHGRSLGSDAEIEEERRLMYVAMTRARHELAISFYDIPSRFLSELPSDKLMFTSLTGDGADRPFDDEERYISYD